MEWWRYQKSGGFVKGKLKIWKLKKLVKLRRKRTVEFSTRIASRWTVEHCGESRGCTRTQRGQLPAINSDELMCGWIGSQSRSENRGRSTPSDVIFTIDSFGGFTWWVRLVSSLGGFSRMQEFRCFRRCPRLGV